MKKLFLSLASGLSLFSLNSIAQQHSCASDEVYKQAIKAHPELAEIDANFNKKLHQEIRKIKINPSTLRTTASNDTSWIDIPIVVHIIHDYGSEFVTDNQVFDAVKEWNVVFAKQNADTSDVIAPFKKYVGNPRIRLRLATKDPLGNPTKGIVRHRSYLTYGASDQAKYDPWPNTSYLNIWFINTFNANHQSAAAYAYFPSVGLAIPHYDGVISLSSYMNSDKTINHEIGHTMSLYHTWGNNNNAAAGVCADGGTDEVDDTPPTIGHMTTGCTPAALYDTNCATNYYKVYTTIYDSVSGGDSVVTTLVNYPDTVNSQNIMDYTYCSRMFTKGQVDRMRAVLFDTASYAGRVNLHKTDNLNFTGALLSRPELKPIPEFNCTNNNKVQYFTCPDGGAQLRFSNRTWNDTITSLTWTFSNGATTPTSTAANPTYGTAVTTGFSEPGWVTVTMNATGNGASGDTTRTWSDAVYVADKTPVNPASYFEDFTNVDKWPFFNYFENNFKWKKSNVGMYDNSAVMYQGYDQRIDPSFGSYPTTGSPAGDYDDMFSVPVDLSGFGSSDCNLNFQYASASRSSITLNITDTLEISYSIDRAKTWTKLSTMTKGTLINNGSVPTEFIPNSPSNWSPKTISIPTAARQSYVVFRFRYKPGVSTDLTYSSGNNFFMDRLNFSSYTAEVADAMHNSGQIVIAPNPTQGNAYVIVKGAQSAEATITVSDIAGKVVYTTSASLAGAETKIEIPQSVLAVKGIYLVQTQTGNNTNTQKLVVY